MNIWIMCFMFAQWCMKLWIIVLYLKLDNIFLFYDIKYSGGKKQHLL